MHVTLHDLTLLALLLLLLYLPISLKKKIIIYKIGVYRVDELCDCRIKKHRSLSLSLTITTHTRFSFK